MAAAVASAAPALEDCCWGAVLAAAAAGTAAGDC